MGSVVNFATHATVKQQRITEQEKIPQEALMQASVEFRKLSEMRRD